MASGSQVPNLTDLLEGPALAPPDGVFPDFAHPGGSHALGYGAIIAGAVISTLAVLSRFLSRFAMKKIHYEELYLLFALGFFAGYVQTIYVTAIFPGVHVHQWNLQLKNLEPWLYRTHLASIFYGLCLLFLKLAILVDWLHIFVPTKERNFVFWSIHVLIWSNVIYYVSGTFLEIFRCWPRQKIWDPLFEGGVCPINIDANNFASTIINLVSDLAILAVPQFVIWKLNMSRAKKAGVSLLFVIGIFAIGSNIARLLYLLEVLHSADALYYVTEVGLWGIGEMAAGFLIIGIPSAPRAAQSLPFSDSVASLLRSLSSTNAPSHERSFIASWRRRPLTRKRRGLWEISELDTFNLVTEAGTQKDSRPPTVIIEEPRESQNTPGLAEQTRRT
ncbi:hypothetical protein F4802DRAFT_551537 [Xylaria palmicola]|nr:hypothetical protein F4802DRAFT_551537 [Xylaria palmicola]